MRIDQPNNTPHAEALHRAKLRKVKGRKHQHQKRGRAIERHKAHLKRAAAERLRLRRNFNTQVRAYWLGLLEAFPAEITP